MASDAVERARMLIGTRFRAQGRDPQLGVDCIGLAMFAHRIAPGNVRGDYRLRGDHRAELVTGMAGRFRRVCRARSRPGDVILLKVAGDQFHLAIRTGRGFIHADARHGVVVETPGVPEWPVVGYFRKRARRARGQDRG